MPLRRIVRAVPALLAALVLTLPTARAQEAGGAGTLTVGVSQFAATLHPSIEPSVAASYINGMARRPITAYGPDWELACFLCVELPTLENGGAVLETTPEGEDGIAVTYTLQPDAAWGDGTPLTTADVAFAWEVGRSDASPFANLELYRSLYALDILDEKTFTAHFDRVTFTYNAINDLRPLPAHLERPVFEAAPEAYRDRTLYAANPTNPGLWFGPYRPAEVEIGAYVVLEPNPAWWGAPPAFDRVVVRTVENTAALEANLLSGTVDMIAGELGLTLDQALAFEQRHGEDWQIAYRPGLIYEHIDLNLSNPVLADRRVRQGLLWALDRQALSDQLFAGRQPVAHTSVSPLDWVHDDGIKTYTRDPDRAVALFEAAGFDRIVDGVRTDAEGRALEFTLMTTAGNRSRELVQQVLPAAVGGGRGPSRPRPAAGPPTSSARRCRAAFPALRWFAWVSRPGAVPRPTLPPRPPPARGPWAGPLPGLLLPRWPRLLAAPAVAVGPARGRAALWSLSSRRSLPRPCQVLPLSFRAPPLSPARRGLAGVSPPPWPSGAFAPVGRGLAAGGRAPEGPVGRGPSAACVCPGGARLSRPARARFPPPRRALPPPAPCRGAAAVVLGARAVFASFPVCRSSRRRSARRPRLPAVVVARPRARSGCAARFVSRCGPARGGLVPSFLCRFPSSASPRPSSLGAPPFVATSRPRRSRWSGVRRVPGGCALARPGARGDSLRVGRWGRPPRIRRGRYRGGVEEMLQDEAQAAAWAWSPRALAWAMSSRIIRLIRFSPRPGSRPDRAPPFRRLCPLGRFLSPLRVWRRFSFPRSHSCADASPHP